MRCVWLQATIIPTRIRGTPPPFWSQQRSLTVMRMAKVTSKDFRPDQLDLMLVTNSGDYGHWQLVALVMYDATFHVYCNTMFY